MIERSGESATLPAEQQAACADRADERLAARKGPTMSLTAEEQGVVETIRDSSTARCDRWCAEFEHANTYPEDLVETMKAIGVFGLKTPNRTARARSPCRARSRSPKSSHVAG
jgi:hypothetical protein